MRQTHFCPHGIFSISMFSSPSDKRCYKNAFTRCPPASWRQYSAVQCPECGWEQGKISLFSSTWWLQKWAQEAGLGGGAGEILWAAAGPIRPPVSAIKCLFYCKGLSNKCVSWFWLVVAQDPEKLFTVDTFTDFTEWQADWIFHTHWTWTKEIMIIGKMLNVT